MLAGWTSGGCRMQACPNVRLLTPTLLALSGSLFLSVASADRAEPDSTLAPMTEGKPPAVSEGAELVAVRDVTLRGAQLLQGARVRNVQVERANGQPLAVSLELKDGHVIRGVQVTTVSANFVPARAE